MDKKLNKIALIVEGGGFKSSFTAGVLDSFIINKFNPFNLYLGVSGGAMNLTSYISLQYKRNIKIILEISKNSNFISLVRFLKGGNYVELKYLLDVAEKKHPFNIKAANNNLSGRDCRFVVTNFETGRAGYLSVKEYGWIKTLEATGTLPIATRGYCEIAGKKYIDGGLANPLPVKRVYDWGYNTIVLIRTNPSKLQAHWKIESLYAPYLYKNNDKLQSLINRNASIYNRSKEYIISPPEDLKIIQIAPRELLKCGVVTNTIENIKADYRNGIEAGLDALFRLNKSRIFKASV